MDKGIVYSDEKEDRWGWFLDQAYFGKTKPHYHQHQAELSCCKELSLAVPGCILSWNLQLPWPSPVEGYGCDRETRKPYPSSQCVPWQHITLRSSCSDLEHKVGIPKGVTSFLVSTMQLSTMLCLLFLFSKISSCQTHLGWYYAMRNVSSPRVFIPGCYLWR